MNKPLIVWDEATEPHFENSNVWQWRSYAQSDLIFSIPSYLEKHSERFKLKYLAFIHELGESEIHKKRLVDHWEWSDGFSFWWMSQLAEKSPFKSPRIYDCLRVLVLEEILLQQKPESLVLYSSDELLVQTLKDLCGKLEIQFKWQKSKADNHSSKTRRFFERLPYFIQGLLSFVRYVMMRWSLRFSKHPKWFSGKKSVFICSYFIHLDTTSCCEGIFKSRQWGDLTKLFVEQGLHVNWLQQFLKSSSVPDAKTGINWLNLFNKNSETQGCHGFLDGYLSEKVLVKAFLKWLKIYFKSVSLRNIRKYFTPNQSNVSLWYFLKHDYLTSFCGTVAAINCLWVELFDVCLDNIPRQRLGLYLYEGQGWERAFLWAWRRHGHGKVIGVQHATVPYWHLYYAEDERNFQTQLKNPLLLPDQIVVNGLEAGKNLLSTGMPKSLIQEVEALRYLELKNKPSLGTRVNQDDTSIRNILVLGDMLPGAMNELLTILEESVNLLPSSTVFTFKSHPGYEVDLSQYPKFKPNLTTERLDILFPQFDAVVSSNSTSAALEAYLFDIPVFVSLDGSSLNMSPLRGTSGVCFFSTSTELVDGIKESGKNRSRILNDSEFFCLDADLSRWRDLLLQ